MEKSENGQQEAQEQETIKNSPFNSIRLSSDQTEPLDLTTSDLAIALEPFGYGKNQLTGQRSTTLRQLPQILTKFQNSRDTVFFTNDGLKAIGAFAAQNPEYVVENEFLNELLSSARQVNAQPNHPPTENQEQQEESSSSPSHEREAAAEEEGSDHRIRTAESPASSNGDRAGVYYGSNLSSPDQLALDEPEDEFQDRSVGEHSFDSNQERTVVLAEQPQTQPSSSKSSPKRTSRTERHQSVPIGFGDSYQVMKRPQPPNRRKKISSVDLHSHTTTPSKLIQQKRSSSLNRDNNYHTENKLGEDRDNDIQSPELVLGTPFSPTQATPFPSSSEDHDSSTQHLTPNNLSSVIYNNRRRGLYDSMSSANTSNLAEQRPPGSDSSDGNPNDILRRLRSPTSNHFNSQQFLLPHRPTSKTHTSVFESGIGLDGYPTPRSSGASISDLQTMSEEYPILIRSCEELKKKNQEFVNQIQSLEKIHEHEIEKLIEELEELKEELVVVKKSEKELSISSNRLMYQLTNSDDHTTRLNNSIANIESNLHKTKLKWEDAVAESEKLRTQLNQKEDELRSANRHIQSHGSEIKKWELDRQLREEHIKNLHLELEELQATREILEEQKQSNLDLKLTIDRLKFELDEQRLRNAGSSVADSRPTSIAGSVGQNLGEEFKKAIKSGEYNQEFGSDTDDGQDDDDDTEEIDRVIKDLDNNRQHSPGGDGDDIFQEIRIRRYKRRSKTLMHGENSPRIPDEHEHRSRFIEEEEIELQDASTDTTDLTTFKTADTQTDPVPEPPPVYRPKMEDLQVQTDEPIPSTSSEVKQAEEEEDDSLSLLKLVAGIDPIVLKLAIDHIKREMINQQHSETVDNDEGDDDGDDQSSSSGSSCLSETVLNPAPELPPKEDPEDPDRSSPKTPDPKKTGWAILSSAFQDLSLNGILESLSSSLSLLNPSLHNRLSKEDPNGKALLRRKIRLYTTIIIFLTIIASLIFRSSSSSALSNSGTYKFTNQASSSSSSCILEAIKKSSIDNQDYLLGILSSSSSSPLNASSPSSNINGPGNPSFIKIIHANSLADLIDFNSVALGKEGFFLDYLKSHFQFFVRLTHFGSQ
ncbi:hypothetical protein MJO29_011291 [Puccinia striiformis f. sp. tritici]|nr:hypothetical protein MJO29_011291 [Puccinia striiformis f. sp. tritici]